MSFFKRDGGVEAGFERDEEKKKRSSSFFLNCSLNGSLFFVFAFARSLWQQKSEKQKGARVFSFFSVSLAPSFFSISLSPEPVLRQALEARLSGASRARERSEKRKRKEETGGGEDRRTRLSQPPPSPPLVCRLAQLFLSFLSIQARLLTISEARSMQARREVCKS